MKTNNTKKMQDKADFLDSWLTQEVLSRIQKQNPEINLKDEIRKANQNMVELRTIVLKYIPVGSTFTKLKDRWYCFRPQKTVDLEIFLLKENVKLPNGKEVVAWLKNKPWKQVLGNLIDNDKYEEIMQEEISHRIQLFKREEEITTSPSIEEQVETSSSQTEQTDDEKNRWQYPSSFLCPVKFHSYLPTAVDISISKHAYLRWLERIGVETEKTEKPAVLQKIKEDFVSSDFIYHKERDDTFFFINRFSMTIFCLSSSNVILSLWRNDFGFCEEINRSITTQQIIHLHNMKDEVRKNISELQTEKQKNIVAMNNISDKIKNLQEQIKMLNMQINEKEREQQVFLAQNDLISIKMRQWDSKLKHEEGLIFCKYLLPEQEEE